MIDVLGVRGMNRQTREDFSSSENTLYYIIMIDTGHYTFVQTKKCTTPRVHYIVNYGLWVIVMCQWRFISCNKCLTLMGDVDNSGSYVNVGAGGMQEISVPLPHFHHEKNMYISKICCLVSPQPLSTWLSHFHWFYKSRD